MEASTTFPVDIADGCKREILAFSHDMGVKVLRGLWMRESGIGTIV